MEDGLVLVDNDEQAEVTLVLILVVVEDGLVLSILVAYKAFNNKS